MSDIEQNPITELQAEWLAVLKSCESSGQSMAAYARTNDLTVKDLYTWKKVLVTKGILPRTQSTSFVKATIKNTSSYQNECRVVLPNGVAVVMPHVSDETSFLALLRNVMQL